MSIGIRKKTGEKCPVSGVWQVVGQLGKTIPLTKGETFPPYGGKSVYYELIAEA